MQYKPVRSCNDSWCVVHTLLERQHSRQNHVEGLLFDYLTGKSCAALFLVADIFLVTGFM